MSVFKNIFLELLSYLKKQNYPTGEKYFYHYSKSEKKIIFLEQKIKIRSLINGKFKLTLFEIDNEIDRTLYHGKGYEEGANIVANLWSNDFGKKETFHIRLTQPYHNREKKMIGLYAGVNFDSKMYLTHCVISPEKITEKDFNSYVLLHSNFDVDKYFMEIN